MSKEYLFELHSHVAPSSNCAKLSVTQFADLFLNSQYDGVMITNHFTPQTLTRIDAPNWKKKIDQYLLPYREVWARLEGKKTVILGAEATFLDSANDYLLFGVTEELLYEVPFAYYSFEEAAELLHANGVYIVQAHPFRNKMTVKSPNLLDGIEVYNGNPRHDSRNDIAELWADKFGLVKTAGSDLHQTEDFGRGGMVFPECPQTSKELAEMIFGQKKPVRLYRGEN